MSNHRIPIIVNGVTYTSLSDASRALGISIQRLRRMVGNPYPRNKQPALKPQSPIACDLAAPKKKPGPKPKPKPNEYRTVLYKDYVAMLKASRDQQ